MNRPVVFFLFLLGLLVCGPAAASDAATVKLTVVLAERGSGPPDPTLGPLQRDLEAAFAGYGSFRKLASHELPLEPGATARLQLPNGDDAEIELKGRSKSLFELRYALPKRKVEVTLRAAPNRYFYQAGLKHGRGMLVLAFYIVPKEAR